MNEGAASGLSWYMSTLPQRAMSWPVMSRLWAATTRAIAAGEVTAWACSE